MWKVTNESNKIMLDKFRMGIIEPFFEILLELSNLVDDNKIDISSMDKDIWKITDKYKKHTNKELIDHVFSRKVDGKTINSLCKTILMNNDNSRICDNYAEYICQNRNVDVYIYNIKEKDVIEELRIIFKDMFYTVFFVDDKIWTFLKHDGYDRGQFHINFKKENKISICPYCDIETTILIPNNEIEHFLPKGKFPFLSMNAYNLIPACHACNTKSMGKGEDTKLPIVAPFNEQIGDNIKYSLDMGSSKVNLNSDDKLRDNYLDLVKLKVKYAQKEVFQDFYSRCKSLFDSVVDYESIWESQLDVRGIDRCLNMSIEKRKKKDPFFFAIKNCFKDFREYKDLVNR